MKAADEIFERVMGSELSTVLGSDIQVLVSNDYCLYPKLSASIGTSPGVPKAWPAMQVVVERGERLLVFVRWPATQVFLEPSCREVGFQTTSIYKDVDVAEARNSD